MSHMFSAGLNTAALRGQIRNPKLEIRNKHQIQMRNSQNPPNRPTRRSLVLRTCSLINWNSFPVSDFGFQISALSATPVKPAVASDEPWEPRKGLHVHGPTCLQIRFEPGKRAA